MLKVSFNCIDFLTRRDEKLPVVLWGKFACDVNDAMQVRDKHCTILVLRFGKIKEWKGSYIFFLKQINIFIKFPYDVYNRSNKCQQCLQC